MHGDYLKAKKIGDRSYRKALLHGRYPYLLALDEIIRDEDIAAVNRLSLMEIPMSLIIGTKTAGRKNSFAPDFMPILPASTEFADKWKSLFVSAENEGIRDPITVYEYMHNFYVEEGNKRVSVMKYNKAASISANVIRVLPERKDSPESRIYYEFVEFFKSTSIYGIKFTKEGSYRKLSALLGEKIGEPWSEQLIRNLTYSFHRFEDVFKAKGGLKLPLTTGDAFLIYIGVYNFHGLIDISDNDIRLNMEKIWQEFLKEPDDVIIVEHPKEIEKTTSILDILTASTKEKGKKTVAFIYERNIEISTWAYGHELGRNYIEEKFGDRIDTLKYENCNTEGLCMSAIDDAVKRGASLIFTTTVTMVELSLKAAIKYPYVKIMNCSVNTAYNSIRTYYARMYEAKFLMGALAAMVSKEDEIAYVEALPVYGAIANINAFAEGAAMINPHSKIYLKWDLLKDHDWRKEIKDMGITTVSGPEFTRPGKISREFGLYRILSSGEILNIAMPVFDWGRYYELIINSYLEGGFDKMRLKPGNEALNYWFGLSSEVVDVILGRELKKSSIRLFNILKKGIIESRILPFEGEFIDNRGNVIKPSIDTEFTSEEILNMNWLNENVEGYIPEISQFEKKAEKIMKYSGVINRVGGKV